MRISKQLQKNFSVYFHLLREQKKQISTSNTHNVQYNFQNQETLNKHVTTDTSINTQTHPSPSTYLHMQDTLALQISSCC